MGGFRASRYIFFEMLPSFLLGVFIFISILLMFQALRLTEFMLVHGVQLGEAIRIMSYLAISFLPVIFPMSLLFSTILTYGRLSQDSEIVAMRALGLDTKTLMVPALVLGIIVTLMSAQTSFNLAPWGNRKFEVLIHQMKSLKASATIKAGVFSEGLFDLVFYTNEIDSKTGVLKKVFIFDERNPEAPLTIVAKEGELLQDETLPQNKSLLRLKNGNIHRTQTDNYTKVDFNSFDVNLSEPVEYSEKRKTPLSYTFKDLGVAIDDPKITGKHKRKLKIEYHRRLAISIACLLFAILGFVMGTRTNSRSAKSGGVILSIGVIVVYWILYVVFEGMAKNGRLPVGPSIWATNLVFFGVMFWRYRKVT